jgi:single-stranded DNA-specific DHH superfamily exonuclease
MIMLITYSHRAKSQRKVLLMPDKDADGLTCKA